MPWTEEQSDTFFQGYWNNESPHCPVCNGQVNVDDVVDSKGYHVIAYCKRGCGEVDRHHADDPLQPTFRKWSDEEQAFIMRAHLSGQDERCPVDGSVLKTEDVDTSDGVKVFVECRRCGEGFNKMVLRS